MERVTDENRDNVAVIGKVENDNITPVSNTNSETQTTEIKIEEVV